MAGPNAVTDPVITTDLANKLIAAQFPDFAGLEIRPVQPGGWDNRTFRLGDNLSMRLPSAARYAAQVQKEQHWLPLLATQLSMPISQPVALGKPSCGYPFHWSIYRWLPGEAALSCTLQCADLEQLAEDLAGFLTRLHQIPVTNGPPPGAHNFWRGAHPRHYAAEVEQGLPLLTDPSDRQAALNIWQDALSSTWSRPPVWVHGDISAGNMLLQNRQLAAVIDFGCLGIGDPACDLTIAWTLLDNTARASFRAALPHLDTACWIRAKGWALWKALPNLADDPNRPDGMPVIHKLINDPT
ncbi:MAG: aminoglycoside phosphotransferase family protein [Alphaproteobacteria bacterium]